MIRKLITAALLVASTSASAGTWSQVVDYPEGGCNRVPSGTMCLSACAFAWLKGSKRINDGIVGFHFPYSPETMQSDIFDLLRTMVFLNERGYMWMWEDMTETTPSKFVMLKGQNVWVVEWRDVKGYKMSSNPSALERC